MQNEHCKHIQFSKRLSLIDHRFSPGNRNICSNSQVLRKMCSKIDFSKNYFCMQAHKKKDWIFFIIFTQNTYIYMNKDRRNKQTTTVMVRLIYGILELSIEQTVLCKMKFAVIQYTSKKKKTKHVRTIAHYLPLSIFCLVNASLIHVCHMYLNNYFTWATAHCAHTVPITWLLLQHHHNKMHLKVQFR